MTVASRTTYPLPLDEGTLAQRHGVTVFVILAIACLAFAAQAGWIGLYAQTTLMFIGINIILAASLNLINGYMGEFSCGHAGFMAVGAYVASVLSVMLFSKSQAFGAPLLPPSLALAGFPFVLLAGGVAAALAGLLVALPSFKTRGDYLAIITLAANYIIISSVENLDVIGGPRGFMGMKKVVNAMTDAVDLPWVLIWTCIGTVLSIWLLRRFVYSTFGKGVSAIHQDEIAAEIMSVNTNKMKLVAFMLSSGLAGIAGGLFAHVIGYVNPGSFNILKSTEIMVMVYLGGMGSLTGSVLAAVLMTFMDVIFREEAMSQFQILKWVIVPLLLIILMQFRPEGIMGSRELTDIVPRLKRFIRLK